MTPSKEQFVSHINEALSARKIHAANDLRDYQCEAIRRMKRLYRGTNLRTRKGVQVIGN